MADMNELQMLAEQSPELRAALSELFATGDMQKFQADMLREARKDKDTPQPDAMQTRGMTVAASPVANIAATMKQIMGGQQEGSIQKAMGDLIRKKAQTADDYNAYIQSQAQKQQARAAYNAIPAEAAGTLPRTDETQKWQEQGAESMMDPFRGVAPTAPQAPVEHSGPMHDLSGQEPMLPSLAAAMAAGVPGSKPVLNPWSPGYVPPDKGYGMSRPQTLADLLRGVR
jgi:hypothetical protein